jgi:serine/threonine protein kinase
LEGLHAAHEARGDDGEPLELIHRDVSPQNIVVTVEGVAKVLDFGIAKARDRLAQTTREGILKGRLRYMAPELLGGRPASRQSDVYSVAVILWEMLAGRALFSGANDGEIFGKVGHETVLPPSVFTPDTPAPLEEVVLRGLSRAVERRFATAHEMAEALASTGLVAPAADVAAWVRANTSADLEARGAEVEAIRAAVASVSHAEMAPASVRRGRTGTSLLVALVVVAGVVAWELRDRVLSLARTTPSASPPSAEVPSVPVEALALTTASPPASTAAGSVPMGTVTKARSSPPHPHSPSPPASAVTHGSCYAVDSTGIWHVRPECL